MRQFLSGLFYTGFVCLALRGSLAAQPSIPPPDGWKMESTNGHYRFTPAVLIPGVAAFSYDIFPPEKAMDGPVSAGLMALAQKDLPALGFTALPGQIRTQNVQSYTICTVIAKDPSGKLWAVYYMAYARPDQTLRYARIIQPQNGAGKAYMQTAVAHFTRLYKQEGGAAQTNSSGNGQVPATASRDQAKGSGTAQKEATPLMEPGKGLQPDQIRGIVLHAENRIGVGGMLIIEYIPYLLLKDGTLYVHPRVSPYDLDVARSRQTEPLQWGVWTLEGKTLTVTYGKDKKPSEWTGRWSWAVAASPDEKISGSFSTISGGGNTAIGGGSIVMSSKSITFSPQGQFTQLSVGGGTYTVPTGSVSAYSNKDAAGTYTANGYSLELRYNNGQVVRQSFYFYSDDKTVFGIGGRPYTQDSK